LVGFPNAYYFKYNSATRTNPFDTFISLSSTSNFSGIYMKSEAGKDGDRLSYGSYNIGNNDMTEIYTNVGHVNQPIYFVPKYVYTVTDSSTPATIRNAKFTCGCPPPPACPATILPFNQMNNLVGGINPVAPFPAQLPTWNGKYTIVTVAKSSDAVIIYTSDTTASLSYVHEAVFTAGETALYTTDIPTNRLVSRIATASRGTSVTTQATTLYMRYDKTIPKLSAGTGDPIVGNEMELVSSSDNSILKVNPSYVRVMSLQNTGAALTSLKFYPC